MTQGIEIGSFQIHSCVLKKWDGSKESDISNLVGTFRINESIYDRAVSASLLVYDTVSLLEDFPLMGEEIVEIEYSDFFEEKRTDKFHLYSVSNISPDGKGQGISYVIHLHSPDFVKSESKEIRRSYRGLLSDSVKDVFDEFFTEGEKELDCEDTANEAVLVVPAMSPWSTINFFARKSYSDINTTSDFYFFENREKYHFKTFEKLYEDGRDVPANKVYTYKNPNAELEDRAESMNNIIEFTVENRFDLIKEFRSGSMTSELVILDMATKTHESVVYEHDTEFDNIKHADTNYRKYHTPEFIQEYFNTESIPKTLLSITDSTLESDNAYKEIIQRRTSAREYADKIVVSCKMYGRNDLFVGDVIKLDLPDLRYTTSNVTMHPSLSGNYLVYSIFHVLEEKKWEMNVTLIKDALIDQSTTPSDLTNGGPL